MNRLARFAGFGNQDAEAQEPISHPEPSPWTVRDPEALREPIIAALRAVYDPEIPVNIYDLGLIYRIGISQDGAVDIDMTLTAPACPVAGMMPVMVQEAVQRVEGVGPISVEVVWDPPWSPEHMTEEARLQLGLL
jgi:FeS assembly SUF system protein